MPESKRRVLLLELDSLSLDFIQRHADHLPLFDRLIREGGLVQTRSTSAIASASVWPTFATGQLPGHHGHYFPFQWHAKNMRFYRPYHRVWNGQLNYRPFWYDLADKGIECQVLDAVQCIPDEHSPCLEINDWSAQSSGKAFASDRTVLAELRSKFGKRPIGAEVPVFKSRKLSDRLADQILDSIIRKSDAIIWLGRNRPWQFYLASIQDAHRAGHNLWPVNDEFSSDVAPDSLLKIYQALDHHVARILDALVDERTDAVLFTLNGMGSNRAQNHFLPQLLHRLNREWMGERVPKTGASKRRGLFAQLRDTVPPGLQYSATRLLGERVQDWVVNREFLGALDWGRTVAFPVVTGGEGLIRLNVSGRERDGLLDPDDKPYRDYIDWLRAELLAVNIQPDGGRLVSDFIELNTVYPGPRNHMLPDIALAWAPDKPATEIRSSTIGVIQKKLATGRGGNHDGSSFALLPQSTMGKGVARQLSHITDYGKIVARLLGAAS
jgi:predicted AlkP superfamily phosphohydrolase/phosphomutase